MLLTRLKYWREYRGLSLRQLAEVSKIPYSAISLLENGKREPQGRTTRKLAQALGVEVVELYAPPPAIQAQTLAPPSQEPTVPLASNDNKTITSPAKPVKRTPAVSYWLFERDQDQEEGDPFRLDTQDQAERLMGKLGGKHQARIYEAASRSEASRQHIQFLIRVTRGHDAW